MTQTPPTTDQSLAPPTPDEVNSFISFVQGLVSSGQIRRDFNPTTPQFWTMLSALAAIIVAWINPGTTISTTLQTTITAVSGLVLALVTAQTNKTPVSALMKLAPKIQSLPAVHKAIIAKSFNPTVLNPAPSGGLGIGSYPYGTASGTVLAPGAISIVPSPGGGTDTPGGVTVGYTGGSGNVSPTVVVNLGGAFVNPNSESNVALGTTPGNNSAEGTGGPVISQRQGGLGTGGSVESPGAYTPPAPNQANPDEANPSSFVAKTPAKRAPARKRTERKSNASEESK